MTKEQEKAIECIKDMINYIRFNEKKKYTEQEWFYAQEEILNLVQTQQAEIEKKDKIIDLMSYAMTHTDIPQSEYCICRDVNCEVLGGNKECKNCIKQYFERKIENDI